ncbi:hypothetical protein [Kocuria sp. CPCC 205263]|uniref:hypothetical protein n=1 Tax=Kocuria sp. CPCC 205263 TaxID=3073555 RepID=UPI0034D3E7CC
MPSIYRAPANISAFVPETLAAAYALAGIDRATPPEERIQAALRALPDAATVARTIIAEAHDTEEPPAKFLAQARRRVSDAQANDALREQWGKHGRTITAAHLPQVTDKASKDLAPAFAATVDALRGAVAELAPQGTPAKGAPRDPSGQGAPGPISLDAEAAVARDAGAALTTARRELARLAVFAGISATGPLSDIVAVGLVPLVPVLAVDGAMAEVCIRSIGQDLRTTNESKLGTTRAVRRLTKDARDDIDGAILGIVAGHYEGVSLRLNSTGQNQHTRQQITAAYERVWVNDATTAPGRTSAVLI